MLWFLDATARPTKPATGSFCWTLWRTRHPWLGSRSRQHRVAELLVMCRTLRKSNILHTSLAIGYRISIFLSPRCNFLSRIQLNMPLAYSLDARNCFQVYLHCFHIFIYCIIAYSFLSMFCLIVALSHLLPTLMTHTKIHLHSCFLPLLFFFVLSSKIGSP